MLQRGWPIEFHRLRGHAKCFLTVFAAIAAATAINMAFIIASTAAILIVVACICPCALLCSHKVR